MHRLVFLVIIFSMQSSTIANVAVQDFATHIEDAGTVLLGMVKEGKPGQVVLVVETSLKGERKLNDEIIVDENSKLAWQLVDGGGPILPANHADFVRQIQQADWYQKRVVLVGSIKGGKWISYCYDWSVWTSGASTRDETLKDLSFEELVEVIKSKLGESTATHQSKTANKTTSAEKPAIAPNPQTPIVQPQGTSQAPETIPMKTPESPKRSIPSEEPPSSTSWSIIVVLIVAVIGMLWFKLKKRK